MPRNTFRRILDECLSAIQRGESIDSCLSRYPQHADQLRPLLETGDTVRRLPAIRPRAVAQEAAWQQFYAKAMTMRQSRRGAGVPWWKPVSIAASGLALFVVAGGGVVYASSKAGPNDQLYPVKLASEEAQVWFSFNDTDKTDVLLAQANTRVDEIVQLVDTNQPVPDDVLNALGNRVSRAASLVADRPDDDPLKARAMDLAARQEGLLLAVRDNVSDTAHDDYSRTIAKVHTARLHMDGIDETVKPADVELGITQVSGIAERSETDENVWIVGGLEVQVDRRAIGGDDLAAGQLTNMVIGRSKDNRLHALNLTARDVDDVPEESSRVTGAVQSIQPGAVVIGGRTIPISDQLLRTLSQGRRVEIDISSQDGAATAIRFRDAPDAIANTLVIEGVAESDLQQQNQNTSWRVSGQTVTITPTTIIDAAAGSLKKGAYTRLEVQRSGTNLLARRVTVLSVTNPPQDRAIISGAFQGTINGPWQVGGLQIDPPLGQVPPPTGTIVRLEVTRVGTRLQALSSKAILSPDTSDLLTTSGFILINTPEQWKVGSITFDIKSATIIDGKPIAGARAVVWARSDQNGLSAVYIDVLDDTAVLAKMQRVTPTPTVFPNVSPTATPQPAGR